MRTEPLAGVLEFEIRKNFVFQDRRNQVELAQVFRRIRAHDPRLIKLRFLEGVTNTPAQARSPKALQFQFHAFGPGALHVLICEGARVEIDQVIDLVVEPRDRRTQVTTDALLINQFVRSDPFGNQGAVVHPFEKIGRAESVPPNRLQRRFLPWIIDYRQSRVDGRLGGTVLIVPKPGVDVQVGANGRVPLQKNAVIIGVTSLRAAGGGRVKVQALDEIISVLHPGNQHMPLE